jgi:exopolyphosphatase/guanosine-5'-triphosphate,3'-diphosphate pyrophosphatase
MLGTSGTITGLAALDAATVNATPPARLHGYALRLDRMRGLQKKMLRMTAAERQKMPGMNPRRGDIIIAGNAIAITAMELLERDELIVCDRALREGIVVDFLARNTEVARRLGDERMRRFDAVHELARRFGSDGVHENHVGALVLDLFDGLLETHGFEPRDRDALFASALLHDVGRTVSPSAHHKHGAYVVRNAGLDGWRPDEVALIAALVRYHRKAMPKQTHLEWAQSDPATRRRIEGLAALLRIADGLDARRLGVVAHVGVLRANGVLTLHARAQQDVGPELEAARFKADLFERTFATRVRFEAETREDGERPEREDCLDPLAHGPAN